MSVFVPSFHPGVILKEEYLDELDMSAGALAQALNVPRTRIERLVNGQTRMTVDTAERLGRYFDTTAKFWLNMQLHYDLDQFESSQENQDSLAQIEPMAVCA